VADQQGDAVHRIVRADLVPDQAMLAEELPVIGRNDDERLVQSTLGDERGEQLTDTVIHVSHRAVVQGPKVFHLGLTEVTLPA
jgi:hypothetical protein